MTAADNASKIFQFKEPSGSDRLPWVVAFLMILGYIATFGLAWLSEQTGLLFLDQTAEVLFKGGYLSNQVWSGGQVWRLLTYAFLHGGMFHLLGNAVMFGIFCMYTRVAFAGRGWLWVFLGSSLIGGLICTFVYGDKPLVGASVGIMGLLGALVASEMRNLRVATSKLPVNRMNSLRALLFLIALQFALEYMVPNVGHGAHLAGLLTGLAIGLVLPLNRVKQLFASREGLVEIVAVKYRTASLASALRGKDRAPVVDHIEFKLAADFDPEKDTLYVVCVACGLMGQVWPRWSYIGYLVGKFALPTEKPFLVATPYEVLGKAPTIDDEIKTRKEEEKDEKQQAMPRAYNIAVLVAGLLLWYLLFQWWSESLLWTDEQVAWLNFLPAFMVSLAKMSGALLICGSAASFITRMVSMVIRGFVVGARLARIAKEEAAAKTDAVAQTNTAQKRDKPGADKAPGDGN